MEQLQNLFTNIALGLRRLESELEDAQSSAEQPADQNARQAIADKARRVTLRIIAAANRSSWCSACELATFVETGATERKTYKPKRVFLRRPMFLHEHCKRLLRKGHMQLIETADVPLDDIAPVDVITVEAATETTASDNEIDSMIEFTGWFIKREYPAICDTDYSIPKSEYELMLEGVAQTQRLMESITKRAIQATRSRKSDGRNL